MNAYVPPAGLLIIGATLFTWGSRLPAYHDPNWDQRIDAAVQAEANFDSLTAEWYAAKTKAETPRNQLMDLGAGLGLFGASVMILFAIGRVRSWGDVLELKSPSSRIGFVIRAGLVWLSFIPTEWIWFGYTFERGDYPWWADSIGIPIFEVQAFGLFGLPIITMGAIEAVHGAMLPANLWTRPIIGRSYVVAPLIILAAVAALAVLLSGVVITPFIVPSAVFTLYLLLSGRAAAAQRSAWLRLVSS